MSQRQATTHLLCVGWPYGRQLWHLLPVNHHHQPARHQLLYYGLRHDLRYEVLAGQKVLADAQADVPAHVPCKQVGPLGHVREGACGFVVGPQQHCVYVGLVGGVDTWGVSLEQAALGVVEIMVVELQAGEAIGCWLVSGLAVLRWPVGLCCMWLGALVLKGPEASVRAGRS